MPHGRLQLHIRQCSEQGWNPGSCPQFSGSLLRTLTGRKGAYKVKQGEIYWTGGPDCPVPLATSATTRMLSAVWCGSGHATPECPLPLCSPPPHNSCIQPYTHIEMTPWKSFQAHYSCGLAEFSSASWQSWQHSEAACNAEGVIVKFLSPF